MIIPESCTALAMASRRLITNSQPGFVIRLDDAGLAAHYPGGDAIAARSEIVTAVVASGLHRINSEIESMDVFFFGSWRQAMQAGDAIAKLGWTRHQPNRKPLLFNHSDFLVPDCGYAFLVLPKGAQNVEFVEHRLVFNE